MNTLKRFNEVFIDLLRDLIHACPTDSDLRHYKIAVKALLLVNKNVVINVFQRHLFRYKEAILNKEESFFVTNTFSEIQSNTENSIVRKIITKLQSLWINLPDKTKQIVWLHFHILILMYEQQELKDF